MRRLTMFAMAALASCRSSGVQTSVPGGDIPQAVLSAEALEGIRPAMQRYIDDALTGGIMTMVSHRGRIVYWDAVGYRDIESRDSLEPNDIFRIYSMTKPVTTVAAMMLVEAGHMTLDDPVGDHIPALADLEVLVDGQRVPAQSPVTVADLMGHTAGMTYGFFSNTPVDELYRGANVFSDDLQNLVDEVAELPLLAQPGSVWHYSVSTDVLGYLVAELSGQAFDEYLRSRIFIPLGMVDTDFYARPETVDRLVTIYTGGSAGLRKAGVTLSGDYTAKPRLLSGGYGLVSTAADYVRFAQMFLNGGELDGVRLLRPETVELMRTNRLADELMPIQIGTWQAPGYGFGLGVSVLVDETASVVPDHNGVFRWWGYGSTYFWIDPRVDLIGMVWTQLVPPILGALESEFQTLVYEAFAR